MKKHWMIAALFAVLAGITAGWFVYQGSAALAPAQPVVIDVPKGASSVRIARMLAEAGVIRSPFAFRLHARLRGLAGGLQSGEYRFEQPASLVEVLQRLHRGDVIRYTVTVPEGLRTDEILQLLATQSGIALDEWLSALSGLVKGENEGVLLPETYQYSKPLRPEALLREMRDAQQKVLDGLNSDANEQQRLRIIASIIEKETSLDSERPLVSAVIRNRLQRHMPLQMDPTVIYGIYKTRGSFSGDIRKRDLLADTPWSTYTRRGLPPTPICNPGAASLRAAAAPADVDYLFFVANGEGGHAFAATNAEHQANVERWLKIEKRRNVQATESGQ